MPVRIVEDPVGDPRWSELLDRHPAASIFHSPGWLSALRQTYGYEPFVVTTSPRSDARERRGGVPREGMDVAPAGVAAVLGSLRSARGPRRTTCPKCSTLLIERCAHDRLRSSVELRPRHVAGQPFDVAAARAGWSRAASTACTGSTCEPRHTEIFRRFHHSSTQRAIRRAEREGLTYEVGNVGPVARQLLPAAADDAPPPRLAAAAARLVSQPVGESRRPGRDPRREQGRPSRSPAS